MLIFRSHIIDKIEYLQTHFDPNSLLSIFKGIDYILDDLSLSNVKYKDILNVVYQSFIDNKFSFEAFMNHFIDESHIIEDKPDEIYKILYVKRSRNKIKTSFYENSNRLVIQYWNKFYKQGLKYGITKYPNVKVLMPIFPDDNLEYFFFGKENDINNIAKTYMALDDVKYE